MTLAERLVREYSNLISFMRTFSSETPATIDSASHISHRTAISGGGDSETFGMTDGCYLRVAYGALDGATAAEGLGRLVAGVGAL
jgi:hypothetical protein